MKKLNRDTVISPPLPEKVLMFGEGNFLRAFAVFLVQKLNDGGIFNGGVVALQGISQGLADLINSQDGLYHVIERGVEKAKTIDRATLITSLNRCVNPYENYDEFLEIAKNPHLELIISNTTEFGICYNADETKDKKIRANFPAKLTDFLYNRYLHFGGALDKGLVILPCELIEKNADTLKAIIIRYAQEWELKKDFIDWINNANLFANTLVDRIVSGYPKDEAPMICERLGFEDKLLDVCEPFFLWAIEADSRLTGRVPLNKSPLNVAITNNLDFYRVRKVRILNGAHTMSALAGHLCGFDTVERMIKDELFERYIKKGLMDEVIPAMQGEGLISYAQDVIERFLNPYLNHRLLSIALNSISKFKSRILPSIKDYYNKFGVLPNILTFSLAALIEFYLTGIGDFVQDEKLYLDAFINIKKDCGDDTYKIAQRVLQNGLFWGEDLSEIEGFTDIVAKRLQAIRQQGIKEAIKGAIK
jgi:tagaturonate reductase